jgi:hypothetical protein
MNREQLEERLRNLVWKAKQVTVRLEAEERSIGQAQLFREEALSILRGIQADIGDVTERLPEAASGSPGA